MKGSDPGPGEAGAGDASAGAAKENASRKAPEARVSGTTPRASDPSKPRAFGAIAAVGVIRALPANDWESTGRALAARALSAGTSSRRPGLRRVSCPRCEL